MTNRITIARTSHLPWKLPFSVPWNHQVRTSRAKLHTSPYFTPGEVLPTIHQPVAKLAQ
ncbi:MAG: hypothetical protein J2P37_31185 [Ktedonobacteraceae bacterium]|nr:hypothetical protein [Ktedonobacteraceae bacterium]MBO0791219.1 hypothetical protein [Ktedonobacteraceae bacterium]